eukprot:CAMPEP_0171077170 /NCGR_PEP_ID=MMETSP0766_2-20121228/13867_1 /TAXON_ID=439317 /ORGANISM="Gambierdiscus australes, Strain CAWD 149" /LENGTH=170 /DNA_ID=CAMNT_0011534211 /DNA_START=92 /DNA_END=604 /DNA_ORIENTATION=-
MPVRAAELLPDPHQLTNTDIRNIPTKLERVLHKKKGVAATARWPRGQARGHNATTVVEAKVAKEGQETHPESCLTSVLEPRHSLRPHLRIAAEPAVHPKDFMQRLTTLDSEILERGQRAHLLEEMNDHQCDGEGRQRATAPIVDATRAGPHLCHDGQRTKARVSSYVRAN